jgi:hypothetical protein
MGVVNVDLKERAVYFSVRALNCHSAVGRFENKIKKGIVKKWNAGDVATEGWEQIPATPPQINLGFSYYHLRFLKIFPPSPYSPVTYSNPASTSLHAFSTLLATAV